MSGGSEYESIMSGLQIFLICMGGIFGVAAIALTPLIGLFWRGIIRDVRLIGLTAEMVRAGFSAADIERVVRVTTGAPRARPAGGPD